MKASHSGEVYSVQAGFPVSYSSLHQNPDCWMWMLDHQSSAWSAYTNNDKQWVQVSSIKPEVWVAVITQGRPNYDQRVLEYQVSYTMDGFSWNYVENGKKFIGNNDRHTKVRTDFEKAITARAIRIHPTKWREHISMRFDAIFIST